MQGHEVLNSTLSPLRNFLARDSINKSNIEWIKKYLEKITLLTGLTYKEKISTFQRVTINSKIFSGQNNRITEIKYLANPPKELVQKFGRANFPQESILYATFDPITALSEMRPKIGDLITISTWRLKTDYDLTVTPIFKNSTKNGEVHNRISLEAKMKYAQKLKQYDAQLQKQLDIVLQFITDCFNKEVNDKNHLDYFLSSYYANRLFWELQDGEIDAILYPSVRQSLTLTNIALKPLVFTTNYKLELVEEMLVTQIPSSTISEWAMEETGYSRNVNDNRIGW